MSEVLTSPETSSPGAPSPEEKAAAHSRRTFLFKLSVLLNAAVGAVLAAPLLGYLLGPAAKKDADEGLVGRPRAREGFPGRGDKARGLRQSGEEPWRWRDRQSGLLGPAHLGAAVPGLCDQLRSPWMSRALVRSIQALHVPVSRRSLLRRRYESVGTARAGGSSSTDIRPMAVRLRSTPAICPHWRRRPRVKRSLLCRSNRLQPKRGPRHGKPEAARHRGRTEDIRVDRAPPGSHRADGQVCVAPDPCQQCELVVCLRQCRYGSAHHAGDDRHPAGADLQSLGE